MLALKESMIAKETKVVSEMALAAVASSPPCPPGGCTSVGNTGAHEGGRGSGGYRGSGRHPSDSGIRQSHCGVQQHGATIPDRLDHGLRCHFSHVVEKRHHSLRERKT